jgi:hypothetical protein
VAALMSCMEQPWKPLRLKSGAALAMIRWRVCSPFSIEQLIH